MNSTCRVSSISYERSVDIGGKGVLVIANDDNVRAECCSKMYKRTTPTRLLKQQEHSWLLSIYLIYTIRSIKSLFHHAF